MALIRFAVASSSSRDGEKGYQINHLYQHCADAESCAAAYFSQCHTAAFVAELDPPLAVSRRADTWVAADWDTRRLNAFGSRRAAESALKPGDILIETPIRKGMPVQSGVPQFSRARGL